MTITAENILQWNTLECIFLIVRHMESEEVGIPVGQNRHLSFFVFRVFYTCCFSNAEFKGFIKILKAEYIHNWLFELWKTPCKFMEDTKAPLPQAQRLTKEKKTVKKCSDQE